MQSAIDMNEAVLASAKRTYDMISEAMKTSSSSLDTTKRPKTDTTNAFKTDTDDISTNTITSIVTPISGGDDLSSQDITSFPNNEPRFIMPVSYKKYEPEDTHTTPSSLDKRFQNLNAWIFGERSNVSVNLFQAGRKKNFGHMDNQFTMLYLPVKPDDLVNWLECFNVAASIKPAGIETDGYEHYTWQSVVSLPRSKLTTQLSNKYKSNERSGFCDAPIVEEYSYYKGEDASTVNLERTFPKIAALAGITKDKNVPKGWISFTKRGDQCSLAICKGITAEPKKSKAPKGLAFEGKDQHTPVDEPLFQMSGSLDIHGLHDLFCVVEGLLMTLWHKRELETR